MSAAQSLPYHLILRVGKCLKGQGLINFLATTRNLTQDLVRYSLGASLTKTPFNEDLPPVTHAIKTGNTELFAEALQYINLYYPQGWTWFRFYNLGVSELLKLAAAHNLESLQYLIQLYPLRPGLEETNTDKVLIEDFYTLQPSATPVQHEPAWVDYRNQELLDVALLAGKLDCVSFLLRGHEPPLFPSGLSVLRDMYLTSADTLEFLLDNGAQFPPIALHIFATLGYLPDPRIFDVSVQHGIGIDSLPQNCTSTFLRQAYTPLLAACYVGQPTAVEALLRLGAKPDGLQRPWIRPASSIDGLDDVSPSSTLDFYSPNPILALLFSHQPFQVEMEIAAVGRKLLSCFDLLVRFGASLPTLDDDMCRILLRRIWTLVCCQTFERLTAAQRCPTLHSLNQYMSPDVSGQLGDLNEGVKSLFSALKIMDVRPWDDFCDRIVELNPDWKETAGGSRGKDLLMKLFHDYQITHGDLPGPAQVRFGFAGMGGVPFRYEVHL